MMKDGGGGLETYSMIQVGIISNLAKKDRNWWG